MMKRRAFLGTTLSTLARGTRKAQSEIATAQHVPAALPDSGDVRSKCLAATEKLLGKKGAETYTTRDGADRLPTIPGYEVSGVVEALGDGVDPPGMGEAVFGLTDFNRDGAAAEYVLVHAEDLAPKPSSLRHIQAASVPLSA